MADQVLVDAVPRIDLANLIEELKTKNRESLLEAIEVYQERLLDELCGKKRKTVSLFGGVKGETSFRSLVQV